MDPVTALGLAAATCTTVGFLPQIVRNWRTGSAGDLSFGTFGLLTLGVALWLAYGLRVGDVPLVASNGVTLVLLTVNLGQMVWYRRRDAAGRPGR